MNCKVKKEIVLKKSGVVIPVGAQVVALPTERATRAKLVYQGQEFQVKSLFLGKFLTGFKVPAAKFLDPDYDYAIVPSLTGENVEPDGYDSKGWPSVFLAAGMI